MARVRTAIAVALATFSIAAVPAQANDFWLEPDGGPNPINVSGDLELGQLRSNIGGFSLTELAGTPHLAWSEWNGQVLRVHVARLDGDEWTQVGDDLNADPARDASSPALAVDGDTLWATWIEENAAGSRVVRVARLDGDEWVDVGGVVDVFPAPEHWTSGQYEAGQSQLAFLNGVPYLGVLEDNSTEYQFTLLRLGGGSWVRATPGGPSRFFISRGFDLEVSGGRLYIDGGSFSGNGVVWRLSADGTLWEDVGLPLGANAVTGLTDVGGVLHTAYTAYHDTGVAERVSVAKLVGGTWQDTGPPVVTADPDEGFSSFAGPVVSVGGVPHLALETRVSQEPIRRELGAVRLSGDEQSWEAVGTGSINHSLDVRGSLLAGIAGVPYLAWAEFDGCNYDVRVARVESAAADDPQLPDPGPCAPPEDPPGEGPGGENPEGELPGDDEFGGDFGDGDFGDGFPGTEEDPFPLPPTGACGLIAEGTELADELTGDAGRDEISGLDGDDRILGLGHADCLFGGAGRDLLDGGTGNDELHGEDGNDRLKGGADSDRLHGDAGNDRLAGGGDEDVLDGGAGNDALTSGDGFDRVSAGAGNDVIDARGAGFDRIDCGSGRDRVKNATRGSDRLRGCERVSYLRR